MKKFLVEVTVSLANPAIFRMKSPKTGVTLSIEDQYVDDILLNRMEDLMMAHYGRPWGTAIMEVTLGELRIWKKNYDEYQSILAHQESYCDNENEIEPYEVANGPRDSY